MTEIERIKRRLKNDWVATQVKSPFGFIIPKIRLVVFGNANDFDSLKDELVEYGAIEEGVEV